MTAKTKLDINLLSPIFYGSSKAWVTHPVIYIKYKQANFAVKQSEYRFNRPRPDQVIELTINWQQTGSEGTVGYYTIKSMVQGKRLTKHRMRNPLI